MCGKLFFAKIAGAQLSNSITGLIVFSFLLLTCHTEVSASEIRQHGSHVHGVGKLNVALDGKDLIIELGSPAANIVGFEHAPKNEQQIHEMHEALELLGSGEKMFALTAKAQCNLHEANVDNDMVEGHHHEHEKGHSEKDHTDETGHSEFSATYHFKCEDPNSLKAINVMLFSHFPGFEEIEVQLLTPKRQTAVELTPKKFQISL